MSDRGDRDVGPDEKLAENYRLSQHPGSEDCPPPETLAALATGELDGAERDAVSDHAVGCRRCARDLQILFATKRETEAARPRRSVWTAALAAAAVLALAALLVPALRRPKATSSDETVRSGVASEDRLVSPPAGAELAQAPEKLSWPALPGDSGYTLKLFDASGAALWESPSLTAATATLPADVRARLANGSFFWVLTAQRPTGSERRGPFPFSIRTR